MLLDTDKMLRHLPDIEQNGVECLKLVIQSGAVQYSAVGSINPMIANMTENRAQFNTWGCHNNGDHSTYMQYSDHLTSTAII